MDPVERLKEEYKAWAHNHPKVSESVLLFSVVGIFTIAIIESCIAGITIEFTCSTSGHKVHVTSVSLIFAEYFGLGFHCKSCQEGQ